MSSGDTPGPIKSVEDVSRSIERCKGNYSFLLGAGTSAAAGIDTAGSLIERWRDEGYTKANPDVDKKEWISNKESQIEEYQNIYGYWFEQQYTTREERRLFIRDLVEDADPTFEHIVISSLMREGHVPITLTPNFDDLVYDAFYLYLEERPFLIDHNALAPQFKITSDDPMLVKLHGDYLYDNLKNTSEETTDLEENIRDVLTTTMNEYGLIVLGYSGRDNSIMDVLNSDDVEIPDPGLYWCTTDASEISGDAKELLQKENTFVVEIESSLEFFYELYENIDDLNIPTPVDIRERASQRADSLENGIINVGGVEILALAREYNRREEYDNAIELLTQGIENDGEDTSLIDLRGRIHLEKEEFGEALKDYRKSKEIHEEMLEEITDTEELEDKHKEIRKVKNRIGIAHSRNGEYDDAVDVFESIVKSSDDDTYTLNYAEALILSGEHEEAIEVIQKYTDEREEDDVRPISLLLIILGKVLSGQDYQDEKEDLQEMKESGIPSAWGLDEIKGFLEDSELDEDIMDDLNDIIEIYEQGEENFRPTYNQQFDLG